MKPPAATAVPCSWLPHSNRRLVEQAAVRNGVRLSVGLEVDSVLLTKRLVEEGLGYSILANAAVQDDIAFGRLSVHSIERPGIRSTVMLTRLRERRNSRLAASWESLLIEQLQLLVTRGKWRDAAVWLGEY